MIRNICALLGAVFSILSSGCAGPAVNSSLEMPIAEREGKISVLFRDFPSGTICSIRSGAAEMSVKVMPGKIVYPISARKASVFCDDPNGSRYEIDVDGSLPGNFFEASTTARPDGSLYLTISTDKGLMQRHSNDAVSMVQ